MGVKLETATMHSLAGKNIPASPRASHYKAKEIAKVLSELNFFYLFYFALLHFREYSQ